MALSRKKEKTEFDFRLKFTYNLKKRLKKKLEKFRIRLKIGLVRSKESRKNWLSEIWSDSIES